MDKNAIAHGQSHSEVHVRDLRSDIVIVGTRHEFPRDNWELPNYIRAPPVDRYPLVGRLNALMLVEAGQSAASYERGIFPSPQSRRFHALTTASRVAQQSNAMSKVRHT